MKSLTETLRSYVDDVNSVLMERGIPSIYHDEVSRNWTDYAAGVDKSKIQNISSKVFGCNPSQVHVEIDSHDYDESGVFFNYYSQEEAAQALQGFFAYIQRYKQFANFGLKGATVRAASIYDTINPNAWVDLTEVHSVEEVFHKLPNINNGTISIAFDINEQSYMDR